MELFPAINIRSGRVVRLSQGDLTRETIYEKDPVAMAEHLVWQGARWLHVVDLDRAFGDGENSIVIERIVQRVGSYVQIQLGGGLRTIERVREVMALEDVTRLILGTAVVTHPELVGQALAEAGSGRIAVGLDARHGRVALRGWQETSTHTMDDIARRVATDGVKTIIYTDISRDGLFMGPDLKGAIELQQNGPGVIVSGGIGSLNDLRALKDAGLAGALLDRALYEDRFTLRAALKAVE
ncbi:MAG: 1-(5-phosphoribosyl)-5-[(5-phosphoribosylamino)methylideneamino] imidazole-4-carboxamide isomerase [Gemmatimonadota bacterium]